MPNTNEIRAIDAIRVLDTAEIETVAGGEMQAIMTSLKLMSEILTNISRTRMEISMTYARNARA